MVSKASEDFPDPDTPVITVKRLCGIASEMSFRLCTRAPRISMESSTVDTAARSVTRSSGELAATDFGGVNLLVYSAPHVSFPTKRLHYGEITWPFVRAGRSG